MLGHVVRQKSADVSRDCTVSIFMIQEETKEETNKKQAAKGALLAA
jgi:hypothetical protein